MTVPKRATSTDIRNANGWRDGFVEWREGDATFLSVVFSWQLSSALKRRIQLSDLGETVYWGGPAIKYAGAADKVTPYAVPLSLHSTLATRTSTGCPRSCPFCIVSVTEGDLVELPSWIPRPIVIDNDLTGCSLRHFDKVIDSLKRVSRIDIQGVSALSLKPYHVERLRELDIKYLHIGWDDVGSERTFRRAWDILRGGGFPKSKVVVYVLIGFRDTPEDALYRLEEVRKLGCLPFPMRYQPPDTEKRNSFVGEHRTHNELVRYCRYWANLRITGKVPFQEFRYGREEMVR